MSGTQDTQAPDPSLGFGEMPDAGIVDQIQDREPAEQSENPEEVAARFRAEVERERRRAEEAERRAEENRRRAEEAERERTTTQRDVGETQMVAITTALDARERETETLETDLQRAHEDGNFKRVAEINRRLGEIGFEVGQLKAGKADLESRRNTESRTAAEPQRQQQADPREAYLASRTPATAAWLRAHPEFFSDPKFQQRVIGAHSLAVADGLTPDSPEYFAKVEEIAGVSQNNNHRQAREPIPSTPPSRGTPAARGSDMRATPEMVRAAQMCGISVEEYMREYGNLKRTGTDPQWKAWAG